jgi:hypothetical protein
VETETLADEQACGLRRDREQTADRRDVGALDACRRPPRIEAHIGTPVLLDGLGPGAPRRRRNREDNAIHHTPLFQQSDLNRTFRRTAFADREIKVDVTGMKCLEHDRFTTRCGRRRVARDGNIQQSQQGCECAKRVREPLTPSHGLHPALVDRH